MAGLTQQPKIVERGSTLHRIGQLVLFGSFAAFMLWKGIQGDRTGLGLLTDAIILAIAVTGLNLITGYTGQISIGHSAFFGLGAYTTAILVDRGWSHGWTFPVAAIVAFVVGCIVGLPALRLKGIYLALVTLGLAVAFPALLNYDKVSGLTNGSLGIKDLTYLPPEWTPFDGRQDLHKWLFWLSLGCFLLVSLVASNMIRSRVGRAMIAVRDNETAAAVMGVDRAVIKTVVFGISAAMTGLAGGLFAVKLTLVEPVIGLFTLLGAITILVAMVIGGTASTWGPIVGAVLYTYINDFARTQGEQRDIAGLGGVIFGVLLILIARFAPFGAVGLLRKFRARFVRTVPKLPVDTDQQNRVVASDPA
ncbi:MAG TPA: branched-chain amino acid ABC transporter permease [Ilumatobacter sp.]|nr:branched-chain amino acid ABC transporter permease [Ilumatobacter sp.]